MGPFELELLTSTGFHAFQKLKKKLVSPPIFALEGHGCGYIPDTDACKFQVGLVLLHEQPSADELPGGYWSRTLPGRETKFSTTKKKSLAVVFAVLSLRPYHYGSVFTVRTDQKALPRRLRSADASGRLAR